MKITVKQEKGALEIYGATFECPDEAIHHIRGLLQAVGIVWPEHAGYKITSSVTHSSFSDDVKSILRSEERIRET
jgi:hypothetical protein